VWSKFSEKQVYKRIKCLMILVAVPKAWNCFCNVRIVIVAIRKLSENKKAVFVFFRTSDTSSSINSSNPYYQHCPSYASSTASSRAASVVGKHATKSGKNDAGRKKPKWRPVGVASREFNYDTSSTELQSARSSISSARSISTNASTIKVVY